MDGHPFGILDGGRKNQKLAAEVVQSGRKLVSIRMPSILEISGSISHTSPSPNVKLLEIIQRNSSTRFEKNIDCKKKKEKKHFALFHFQKERK